MKNLSYMKKILLDLIFPISCLGCQKDGSFLCDSCKSSLNFINPVCFVCGRLSLLGNGIIPGRTCQPCRIGSRIYAYLSPFSYDNRLVRDLIHALKYNRIKPISAILADLIYQYIDRIKPVFQENSLVVFIPLHKSKRRVRGFNQAEIIANELGVKLGIAVEKEILIKVQKTRPQIELNSQERRGNIKDTFSVINQGLVKNKTILLVDDVKTTGSTLEEAASVLKKAGARRVWAITLAH